MIVAAPFLGEFGWEVSLWVPWLRWITDKHYHGQDLTVVCRAGHEHLYEDFTNKTYSFKVGKPIDKIDCQNVWVDGHRLTKQDYMTMAAVAMKARLISKYTITPHDLRVQWSETEPPSLKQGEYRPYGSGERQEGWMCVHARQCPDKQPERDWPDFKWAQFLGEFDTEHVILVGSKKGSMSFSGCEDLRGHPLREVCDAISRCQFIVGPSSGPMALAMLCRTPVVWWSPNNKDVPRFGKAWNPFQVEQTRVSESWNPEVIEVEAACQKFL